MDFTLSEQQQAIGELAATILTDTVPPEVLRHLEAGSDHLAVAAWQALARADLVGLAVPEADGGAGLGVFDAALVAEQVGRHVALVPYWPTVAGTTMAAAWPAQGTGCLTPSRRQPSPSVVAVTAGRPETPVVPGSHRATVSGPSPAMAAGSRRPLRSAGAQRASVVAAATVGQ